MTRARLFLTGIRAEGRHGARDGEKDQPQPFVVDLDIEVDAPRDSIDATADYRGVTDAVREIVEDGSFDLIEAMADAIARRVRLVPARGSSDGRGAQAERRRPSRHRWGGRRGHGLRRRVTRDPVGTVAFLGLGSNLGDRLTNLQGAVDLLHGEPGLRVVASSRVWETVPVGGPPQPDYLNAVIRVETDLSARDLLDVAHRVEERLGRVRKERWGARSIDVDVLLFDEETIDESDLVVPHPRLAQRAFVLLPLLELVADPVLPDGTRLRDLRVNTDGVAPSASPLAVRP